MIDHNFIWETTGSGIYEHDNYGQYYCHNFIGKGSGSAVRLGGKVTNRIIHGSPVTTGNNTIINNIFYENQNTITTKGDIQRDVSNNLSKGIRANFKRQTLKLTWQVNQKPPACKPVPILTNDYHWKERSKGTQPPGLFVKFARKKTTVNMNLISR